MDMLIRSRESFWTLLLLSGASLLGSVGVLGYLDVDSGTGLVLRSLGLATMAMLPPLIVAFWARDRGGHWLIVGTWVLVVLFQGGMLGSLSAERLDLSQAPQASHAFTNGAHATMGWAAPFSGPPREVRISHLLQGASGQGYAWLDADPPSGRVETVLAVDTRDGTSVLAPEFVVAESTDKLVRALGGRTSGWPELDASAGSDLKVYVQRLRVGHKEWVSQSRLIEGDGIVLLGLVLTPAEEAAAARAFVMGIALPSQD